MLTIKSYADHKLLKTLYDCVKRRLKISARQPMDTRTYPTSDTLKGMRMSDPEGICDSGPYTAAFPPQHHSSAQP